MKILIADDHRLFLDGMQHVLRQLEPGIEIATVNHAREVIPLVEQSQDFDLILLDMSMPEMDGLVVLKGLGERELWIPVVVVSSTENPRLIANALDAGALGFIPKSHSSEDMLSALRRILDGEVYVPDEMRQQIDQIRAMGPAANVGDLESLKKQLGITPRQFEVLELMAKGYSNKKIALVLNLTEHTVKSHVSVLFQILQASNRTECVLEATRLGLLKGEETS